MKKGAVPELNAKWWDKNKAKTLGKTGFGAVLRTCEQKLKAAQAKGCSRKVVADAIASLNDVVTESRKVASKKCKPKTHAETIAALEKYPQVIKSAKATLTKRIKVIDGEIKKYNALADKSLRAMQKAHADHQSLMKDLRDGTKAAGKRGADAKQVERWLKLCGDAPARAKMNQEVIAKAWKEVGAFADSHPHISKGHARDVMMPKVGPMQRHRNYSEGYKDAVTTEAKKLRTAASKHRRASAAV